MELLYADYLLLMAETLELFKYKQKLLGKIVWRAWGSEFMWL